MLGLLVLGLLVLGLLVLGLPLLGLPLLGLPVLGPPALRLSPFSVVAGSVQPLLLRIVLEAKQKLLSMGHSVLGYWLGDPVADNPLRLRLVALHEGSQPDAMVLSRLLVAAGLELESALPAPYLEAMASGLSAAVLPALP